MSRMGQFIKDHRTTEPYKDYDYCTLIHEGKCKGCDSRVCPVK
jgi:hypothetical protein